MTPVTGDEKIRNMYMSGIGPEAISTATEIPLPTVLLDIYGKDGTGNDPNCAAYLKHNFLEVKGESYREYKGLILSETEARAVQLVNQFLLDTPKIESISDARDLIGIMERLDKIIRLEEGRPTDLTASISLTYDDVKRILSNDPMMK